MNTTCKYDPTTPEGFETIDQAQMQIDHAAWTGDVGDEMTASEIMVDLMEGWRLYCPEAYKEAMSELERCRKIERGEG